MGKVIAAINMTLDGFCDHDAIIPDEELHEHYTNLLADAGAILYGRITYQLMQFWQPLVEKPSGEKSMDDFARMIDQLPKIVFSGTLNDTGWHNAALSKRTLTEEISALKQETGKPILAGSRSIILQLLKLNLVDEFQLCVHPVVAGTGLPLFENLNARIPLQLTKTKTFGSGAVTLYYKPGKENKS
jgi:dihydrofolate reductase